MAAADGLLTAVDIQGGEHDIRDVRDRLSPSQAAKRLGVSSRTVQRWIVEGRLAAVRVGDRWKVDPADLDRLRAGEPGGHGPTAAGARPIRRLLVANRGELVVRVARTCRQMGIRCLGLAPLDQQDAWWARQLDEVVPLPTDYLDGEAVIAAALRADADAIHPGYGFLAEQADFAARVESAGLVWVGPPPSAMAAAGDKAAARALAARLDIPTLPGTDGRAQTDAALLRAAERIGYPIITKPAAGGGGKGMHVARAKEDLRELLARARREARAAFGDERLILERYLDRPRHVEVQVLFDRFGNGVHLGERDCSLQRRHQKVVEEAPSPGLDDRMRERLGAAALRLAAAAGYVGAGTVEFLIDGRDFHFIELNARLQVEHRVTEAVTGRDLVADQLRIASGEPLGFSQADVRIDGHAIEARVYAEDPWEGSLPQTGRILQVCWPEGPGIRVDPGVGPADTVSPRYDPLLAKVVATGKDRAEAVERLAAALDATRVTGVTTNRAFLRRLLDVAEVRAGDARTDTIAVRWHPDPPGIPEEAWSLAAWAIGGLMPLAGGPSRPGFRLNARSRLRLTSAGEVRSVPIPGAMPVGLDWAADPSGQEDRTPVLIDIDGRAIRIELAPPPTVADAIAHSTGSAGTSSAVTAPMPGTVLAVKVVPGEEVEAGQFLLVLEAMKMENAVPAPADGRVDRVLVKVGEAVQRGDRLVEFS